MTKTYILEPTEMTFSKGSTTIYVETSEQSPLLTSDLTGSLFSIGDKQFMFCKKEQEDDTMLFYYTPDGNEPENDYDARVDEFIEIEATDEETNIYVADAIGLSAGEYSVSIFKEDGEPDPEPTPGGDIPETIAKLSKNVTYELHPHNDIDRIRFKGNLTNKENEKEN